MQPVITTNGVYQDEAMKRVPEDVKRFHHAVLGKLSEEETEQA